MNVLGKVSLQIIGSPTVPSDERGTCQWNTVWDSQPISMAVAMVATVLAASFRFSMCPDIWLSSSTAYLNMKGTVTLVIWVGRVGGRGEEEKQERTQFQTAY